MEFTEKDIERFWSKVDKQGENECWNWTGCCMADGYGIFTLKKKSLLTHRMSLCITRGQTQQPDKPCALHSCKNNRRCCNPSHLYWGNHSDNMKDRERDGNSNLLKGENHLKSKLTLEQVNTIRNIYPEKGNSYNILAKKYNVSKSCIAHIIRGVNYKLQ